MQGSSNAQAVFPNLMKINYYWICSLIISNTRSDIWNEICIFLRICATQIRKMTNLGMQQSLVILRSLHLRGYLERILTLLDLHR
jgi:hypothetical protein